MSSITILVHSKGQYGTGSCQMSSKECERLTMKRSS